MNLRTFYLLESEWNSGNTATESIDTEARAVELRKYLLSMGSAQSITIWKVTAVEKVEVGE